MTTFGGQLYRFTQLSSDTEITRSFVKLYFTPHTWSLCSANVCIHFRSARSQIFTLVSLEDEAKCLPSWENDTQSTQEEWPDKVLATSEWLLNIYIYMKWEWLITIIKRFLDSITLTHHIISCDHHRRQLKVFVNWGKNINFVLA